MSLWHDLRFGVRLLVKGRWFTLAAIVALALGIGANVTIFTIVNAVLLADIPFEKPEQIVAFSTKDTQGRQNGVSILFALEGNKLLWERDVPYPAQAVAPIAIGQTAVYEAGDDGVLYAYAREDGRPLWQYRVSEAAIGQPTVGGDGTIYVTGPRQNLHAIAPDGKQRWVAGTQK